MNRSKLTVIFLVGAAVVAAFGARLFLSGDESQTTLAKVSCEGLLPTFFEIQGEQIPMTSEQTCEVMKMVGGMTPTGESFENRADDPWHYYGRMRILPKNDVWFLVFVARRSTNFHPEVSLQRRRGSGWSVAGMFDAEPILRSLNALERIDRARLAAAESQTPVDQSTAIP